MAMERPKRKNLDGITQRRRESESADDFYTDIDQSSNNFTLFWLLVIFILLLSFTLVLFLGLKVKRGFLNFSQDNASNSSELASFAERVKDLRGGGHKILIFNQEEFAAAAGLRDADFPLSAARFEINKDRLQLVGKIKNSLVFWPIKLNISCGVVDNRFRFLIAPDSFENIILPTADKNKIQQVFEKNINQVLEENQARGEEIVLAAESIELHLIKEEE